MFLFAKLTLFIKHLKNSNHWRKHQTYKIHLEVLRDYLKMVKQEASLIFYGI